jgi:HEPN domain-containing protein
MSHKKNQEEAARWLTTGQDDLDTARILKKNGKYAHACFHAQQAVEKAVKGVWYFYDADPWGHSILRLIRDFKEVDADTFTILNKFAADAQKLDRLYIPTRYPNGLPDITPDMAYGEDDSQFSITAAEKILNAAETIIKSTQDQDEPNKETKTEQSTQKEADNDR